LLTFSVIQESDWMPLLTTFVPSSWIRAYSHSCSASVHRSYTPLWTNRCSSNFIRHQGRAGILSLEGPKL